MSELKILDQFIGKTITKITKIEVREEYDDGMVEIMTSDGKMYKMYHRQDCCESVDLDDIEGELTDLIGSPILLAEEVTNSDNKKDESDDSWT